MKQVTGAVIIRDNRVLIMRRSPNEAHAGFWEFPGGKIEKGEYPEACLFRELKEELNIETKIVSYFCDSIYEYSDGCIQLLIYIVEILNGEITLTVHDKLKWANKEDLLTIKLLPADIPVSKRIIEELL